MKEKHYLIVKGWESVQNYLGTKLSIDTFRKKGIKRLSKKGQKGRGVKVVYAIPYSLLEERLVENQDKFERLAQSLKLLKAWKKRVGKYEL